MTTNKDSNPPGRVVRPVERGPEDLAPNQPPGTRYRSGEELDPATARGHGTKRQSVQGRGDDPELDAPKT